MRVLICTGRFYADTLTRVLDLYASTQKINVLIHGGHQSLGGTIETWARGTDVHVIRYPANWALHDKYAETRRNLFMLEDSCPDVLTDASPLAGTVVLAAPQRAQALMIPPIAWISLMGVKYR